MAQFRSQMTDEVRQRLARNEKFTVLDVREHSEWISGHIPNAKHIPLMELPTRIAELNKADEIVVVCHSGGRSYNASEYLAQMGYNVVNMLGGMSAWRGDVVFGE